MYYNADGIIIESKHNLKVALLQTSGAYDSCSSDNETTNHAKAAYGLLAMLHTAARLYNCADIELFKKLNIPFVHVTKKKIRLCTLNLATDKTYVLHRKRSTNHQHQFQRGSYGNSKFDVGASGMLCVYMYIFSSF